MLHKTHQLLVRDRVEETLDVGLDQAIAGLIQTIREMMSAPAAPKK
jgi:hypothetical protein